MLRDKYILLIHKKLSGQISKPELKELKKWSQENASNAAFVSEIEHTWKQASKYKPSPQISTEKAKSDFFKAIQVQEAEPKLVKLETKKRQHPLFYRWTMAAAVIVLLIGAFFVFQNVKEQVPAFMSDQALMVFDAEREDQQLTLVDGTKLWLKKNSYFRLAPDFNGDNRQVFLEGEMFIHVADNAELPFIINMQENVIRVIGTAFYIKSTDDNQVELQVAEGKVEFSGLDEKAIVEAGQQIIYDRNKDLLSFLEDQQDPVVSNWRNSYLVFDEVPLSKVFEKLSIFYGVEFSIECNRIDELKGFTSLIQYKKTPKLHTFIQTLRKVYGIDIEKTGEDTYRIFGEACN